MAPNPENARKLQESQKLAKTDPSKAEATYKDILSTGPDSGEAALREYETALIGLGELYRDNKKPNELAELVRTSRSTLSSFAKAKTAKLGKITAAHAPPLLVLTECPCSPPTPRSSCSHPEYYRYPNISHQIMHRMGHLGTSKFSAPKPGDQTRITLHDQTILL